GHTGTGGAHTAVANISVVVDLPPVVSNVAANATYTENAAAVTLSPSLSITDPDGGNSGNGTLNFATVTISSGFVQGDQLVVLDPSAVGGASTSGSYTGTSVQWNYNAATH